jgi:hypothetical protein
MRRHFDSIRLHADELVKQLGIFFPHAFHKTLGSVRGHRSFNQIKQIQLIEVSKPSHINVKFLDTHNSLRNHCWYHTP